MTLIIEPESTKPEYELRPIGEIVKRYKRIIRECNKELEKDEDTEKFNHIAQIQRGELAWVLGKD